jgi:Fe-S oxidoreductase
MVKYFYHDIGEKAVNMLSSLGWKILIPDDQVCCGAPFLHLGEKKIAKRLAFKNLKSFKKNEFDYLVTLCPTGNWIIKEKYPFLVGIDFKDKVSDFTEFLVRHHTIKELQKNSLKTDKEIFYHQPCHYSSIFSNREPVKLLKSLGYKVAEEEEPVKCCGFSGVFSFKNPEISEKIWQKKRSKILKSEPGLIITNCPGCIFQIESHLKKTNPNLKVIHFSQLFS